jgi:two-component system nitrogen regulation sensor histidine kinase NtrY
MVRLLIFTLLVIVCTLAFYLQHWLYALPLLFLLLLSGWYIIYYVNAVNRKLTYFFEAVKNEDGSLHFPENVRNRSLQGLHKSMNRINNMILETKIKNEHNQRFFLEFMKHSSTGLMVVDERGYIDTINSKALRFCRLAYISHIQRLAQSNPALYKALSTIMPGESRSLKWLDGHDLQQVSLKVVILNFREKKYRIYSLYDIRAEMEENELETWQKLIRVMTHEIMNSIAPITSLSNTLSKFYIKNGEKVSARDIGQKEINDTIQGLAVIEERGEGLMNFVDNYRKLTKVPKPNFKPVFLHEWLQNIEWLVCKRMEDDDIRLCISHHHTRSSFLADEKLLTQVMLNLINNAADALVHASNKHIKIVVSEGEEGKLKIAITDNGLGFSAEERDNLFIPFYTTKENGSGIGLSLSKQIIRLHKGSISARSIPGRETTVELLF